jgi:hypothetical protein
LARVRQNLEKLSPLHEGEAGSLGQTAADIVRVSFRLEDRFEWGLDAPAVVAVLGATGTGKSKIFNTLVGKPVSPSGYKRPTTMAPVLYAPAVYLDGLRRQSFMAGYDKREAGEDGVSFNDGPVPEIVLVPSRDPARNGAVLVDTPDFDSVLGENRAAAADVFARADAIVFVTDAVKYADQASWEYLDLIRDRGKTAVLVINRLRSPLSLDDFNRRLAEAGLDRPMLSLPDQAGLADGDPLPAGLEAIAELRRHIGRWAGEEREEILLREAAADWDRFAAGMSERLLPALAATGYDLARLKEIIAETAGRVGADLERTLAVTISGELRHSLLAQIQTLFLRWDVLKYPRRIMAMPFTFVRDRVLAPLGVLSSSKDKKGLETEVDRLFEANREGLVAAVQEFNRQAGEIFKGGPAGRGLALRPDFASLALPSDDVRDRYKSVRADLEAWVEQQARELVQGLGLGEKMTFYVAQVVSLGLFISIQVHTGGGFSFMDGLLDSVLAPILSKITGSALSREKVKAFETKAAAKHLEGCRRILEEQARTYRDYVEKAESGLASGDLLKKEWLDLEKAVGALK